MAAIANSQPPPKAKPFTAAMIGFGEFSIYQKHFPALFGQALCRLFHQAQ